MTFTTRGKLRVIRRIRRMVNLMTLGTYSIIEVRLAQEQARSRNSVFLWVQFGKEDKNRGKNQILF